MSNIGPYITATQTAISTPFDNSTDGFASTNVQAAIEEAAKGAPQRSNPQWKDDFINGGFNNAAGSPIYYVGELIWAVMGDTSSNSIGTVTPGVLSGTSDSGHPGQLKFNTNASATGAAGIGLSVANMVLGGGAITQEWNVLVTTLGVTAQQYRLYMGFSSLGSQGVSEPTTNGVYFTYAQGVTGNFWVIKTSKASTVTSTTTTSAVTANTWYRLGIQINAAATSVTYLVNGVSVGTITTNIPIVAVSSVFGLQKSSGTTGSISWLDYFTMQQTLTTAR